MFFPWLLLAVVQALNEPIGLVFNANLLPACSKLIEQDLSLRR